MRLWRAIVLMGLALMVGMALGYVRWGREARQLRETLAVPPEQRQRSAESGRWTARGVVRILLRDQGVVFLTHEAIPGVMPGGREPSRRRTHSFSRAFHLAIPSALLWNGVAWGACWWGSRR